MRIQDTSGILHPSPSRVSWWREPANIFKRALPSASTGYRSAIIPNLALKSRFFISLGASRLTRALLASCSLMVVSLSLISCGSYSSSNQPPSRLSTRVLISQGVSSPTASPGLLMINGALDTPARVSEISAGASPSFMTLSPTKAPLLAAPPVDTGCDLQPSPTQPPPTCTVVNGFDRPVYGFFSSDGSAAYILNCGQECGGT